MENTSRPWVYVVAGTCGVLLLAIAFKHFGRGERTTGASPDEIGRVVAKAESRGWSARESSEGDGMAGADGSGGTGQVKMAGSEHARDRAGTAGFPGTAGQAGNAAVLAAGRRSAGGIVAASGGTAGSGGQVKVDAPGAAGRATAADALKRVGGDVRRGAGTSSGAVLSDVDSGFEAPTDPNQPVLSLPLDKSLETEDGKQPVAAQNVNFDDSGHAIFDVDSHLAVPEAGHVNGKEGSLAFWVKPQWAGSDDMDAYMVDLGTPNNWPNRMHIVKNGRYLRFMFFDNLGVESGVSYRIDSWQPGDSHHIAASWGEAADDGQHRLAFYVDGKEIGSQIYDGEFEVPTDRSLFVGNSYSNDQGTLGSITSFRVYSNPADPERVQTLYGDSPPQ